MKKLCKVFALFIILTFCGLTGLNARSISPTQWSTGISGIQTFTITSNIKNVTCPGGRDANISVSVLGGTPPYLYQWNDSVNQTTAIATGLSAGNYSLVVSDNSGNDSTISFVVLEPSPIADNAKTELPSCTNNGYIILTPSGGTAPYKFLWDSGQTVAGIKQISPGNYAVHITDANKCAADFSYSITEKECFIEPTSYFTPNEDGYNDSWHIANSEFFPNAKLIVFDRWGTKVYEHKGLYESWDGKSYLGIPVPDAVYYYFFFRDADEKQKDAKHGSVTIIR